MAFSALEVFLGSFKGLHHLLESCFHRSGIFPCVAKLQIADVVLEPLLIGLSAHHFAEVRRNLCRLRRSACLPSRIVVDWRAVV